MGMGSWVLEVSGGGGGAVLENQVESWVNIFVLSGVRSKKPLLAAFSHSFLPWVGSVRALWRNTRMNSLNSFPERLTMLKTNFVVREQVSCSHFTFCPHSSVESGTFLSTPRLPSVPWCWLKSWPSATCGLGTWVVPTHYLPVSVHNVWLPHPRCRWEDNGNVLSFKSICSEK